VNDIPEEFLFDHASVSCPHGVEILVGTHWGTDPMIPTGNHLSCLDKFLEEEKDRHDEELTDLMMDLWRQQ
jgi:hypothetical protein